MRVVKVTKSESLTIVPVYDLCVPSVANFCLASGDVIHNSKDIADAMCGTYVNLLGKRQAWRGMAEFEAITAAELSEEKDGGDDTQHKERRLQKKRREVKRR